MELPSETILLNREITHVDTNEVYKMITLKLSTKQIEEFKKIYSLEELQDKIIENFSKEIRKAILWRLQISVIGYIFENTWKYNW